MDKKIILIFIVAVLVLCLSGSDTSRAYQNGEVDMIEIELIPRVGIEIENIGKVNFGQTPEEVEKILGEPDTKQLSYRRNGLLLNYNPAYIDYVLKKDGVTFTDDMNYYYYNSNLMISFNADKRVEFIECNTSLPFQHKTKAIIYGADFFDLSPDEAIKLLIEKNNGSVIYDIPHRPRLGSCYLELDVGIWRDMDEDDFEETVRLTKEAGMPEMDSVSYKNEFWRSRHFWSIGIGEKGYYARERSK